MKASFRVLFRKLNLILCYCIFVTAVTGIILGISNRFFSLPTWVIEGLRAIHQGALLGNKLSNFYVLFLGFGVFILGLKTVIAGKYNVFFARYHPLISIAFWVISPILVIPLTICVQTGVAQRLGASWFNVSSSQTMSFIQWHSGTSLNQWWNITYMLVAGISLAFLSVLNSKDDNLINLEKKIWQDAFKKPIEKLDLAKNDLSLIIGRDKSNLQKLGILIGSITFCGFIYYLTPKVFIALMITISIIIFSVLVKLIFKELFGSQKKQKTVHNYNNLMEEEAESITMLKAIPDSILRMSQDGICLSYMPSIDTKYFVLEGNIINRHVTEFVEPKIALGLIHAAKLSLNTGSTQIFRFSVLIDNGAKYHEARVTGIGSTEVLILVREIVNYNDLSNINNQPNQDKLEENTEVIKLFTESDLVQTLEKTLECVEHNQEVHSILVCLALRASDDRSQIEPYLLRHIVIKVSDLLPGKDIFQVQDNNLILLVRDRTIEEISVLVNNLNHDLNKMFPIWQKDSSDKIESSVCLLEVDHNSSDALSLIETIQISCQMAKQKVRLKTF